jgi:hypothetical protein
MIFLEGTVFHRWDWDDIRYPAPGLDDSHHQLRFKPRMGARADLYLAHVRSLRWAMTFSSGRCVVVSTYALKYMQAATAV